MRSLNPNWNWWKEIRWRIGLWRILLSTSKYEHRIKHMRRKYCRFGFHKIKNSSRSYYSSEGDINLKINFLRCQFCNYFFFASKEDKDTYKKIEELSQLGFRKFSARFVSSSLKQQSRNDLSVSSVKTESRVSARQDGEK